MTIRTDSRSFTGWSPPARLLFGALLTLLSLGVSLAGEGSAAITDDQVLGALKSGDDQFSRGHPALAIPPWTQAIRRADEIGSKNGAMLARAKRAEAYQSLGYYRRAERDLQSAMTLARDLDDQSALARLHGSLGNVLLLAGDESHSEPNFKACLSYAEMHGDSRLQAKTLINYGNLLASRSVVQADAKFDQSINLAGQLGDAELAATALLNRARVTVKSDPARGVERSMQARDAFEDLPDSAFKSRGLIAVGRLWQTLAKSQDPPNVPWLNTANLMFESAAPIARSLGDHRTLSYALGYRGELYEKAGRHDDALSLTRQALYEAELANAPDVAYRWHWQLGRLLKASGESQSALAEYKIAAAVLQDLRRDIIASSASPPFVLQADSGALFLELTDLLLRQAALESDEQRLQAMLVDARRTMEQQKTVELENYFHDDCVATLEAKATSVDEMSNRAAAIYPIVLDDRIELLVSLPNRMLQVTVPKTIAANLSGAPAVQGAGMRTIDDSVRDFGRLVRVRTNQHRRPGMELYRALISPIEPMLEEAGVDTLVIIASGALRTVSFAALYDGERYLVERYAIAVAPGLTLLDPRPIRREEVDSLLAGLSESVQGQPALPYVAEELEAVRDIFGGGDIYLNQAFIKTDVERALDSQPFTLVHFASHAEFKGDARSSYLLTYDSRMDMDALERFIKLSRFRDEPVELLTLSACDTAVGDDRAALGLAGVAVKAGARSALASLWRVNDESTAVLVSEFYRRLKKPTISKAEALRQSQIELIRGADRRYRFPVNWAPFLLIGNWL